MTQKELKEYIKTDRKNNVPGRETAKALNIMGMKTPSGLPWTQSWVSRFALNNKLGRKKVKFKKKPKAKTVQLEFKMPETPPQNQKVNEVLDILTSNMGDSVKLKLVQMILEGRS